MERRRDREITAEWLATLRTGELPVVSRSVAHGPGDREPAAVATPTRTLPGYRPSRVAAGSRSAARRPEVRW
jgi:hypothetical protein